MFVHEENAWAHIQLGARVICYISSQSIEWQVFKGALRSKLHSLSSRLHRSMRSFCKARTRRLWRHKCLERVDVSCGMSPSRLSCPVLSCTAQKTASKAATAERRVLRRPDCKRSTGCCSQCLIKALPISFLSLSVLELEFRQFRMNELYVQTIYCKPSLPT